MTVEEDIERRAGDRVGSVLRGKYRLERLLGVGGMGSVFAAVHQNNRNKVAIKMLHAELSVNSEIRGRFLREGYIANTVEHPGVVRVLDDDTTDDGAVFLVLDLLEGETLATKLDAVEKLGATEVTRIAIDLLEILSAAHDKGIVHRDIKPDNVFLTKQGVIRILDFGIARLRDAAASGSTTRSGHSVGTPAYMSPEQALGHTKKLGPHSDVWSVGATMFTLLTGKIVHEAESVSEMLVRAATQHVRPIEEVEESVPLAVARVINKALAFEIADRYQTADEMRRDLVSALATIRAKVRASVPALLEETAEPASSDEEIERANTEPPPPMPAAPKKRKAEATVEERAATVSAPTPVIALARAETPPPTSIPTRSPPIGLIVGGAVLVLCVVAGGVVLSRRGGGGSNGSEATPPSAASQQQAAVATTQQTAPPPPPTTTAPPSPSSGVVPIIGAKIDIPPTPTSTPSKAGTVGVAAAPKTIGAAPPALHSAAAGASARPNKPNAADPMDRQ